MKDMPPAGRWHQDTKVVPNIWPPPSRVCHLAPARIPRSRVARRSSPSCGAGQRLHLGSRHHLPRHVHGRRPSGRQEDADGNQTATTHRAGCGMVVTAVLARRLPVQHPRLDDRPLPLLRAADGQRRTLGGRVQPLTPDDLRTRFRDGQEIAPDELGHGYGQQALPRAADILPVEAVPQRHRLRCARHQPLVGHRATTDVTRPIGEHSGAMRIPLPDRHMPFLTAQFVAQSGPLPQGHPIRQRQHPPTDCGINGREQLAPTHRHHHAYRQQTAVADGTPLALGGQPTPVTKQCSCGCSTNV